MNDSGLRLQHETMLKHQKEQADSAAVLAADEWDMDAETLRKAVVWSEILKEPVCRRRRRHQYGDKGNYSR